MNEEITKAQAALTRVKIREIEQNLIPVKVAKNTIIMMPSNAKREDIQEKIKLYNRK